MKSIVPLFLILTLVRSCNSKPQKQPLQSFIKSLKERTVEERKSSVENFLSNLDRTPIIEGNERVTFIWFGQADTLQIEGDFQNSWAAPDTFDKIDCGEKDFFHISYKIPSDAILEYRFIVDGKKMLDLTNPEITQSFDYGDRNIFNMPDFVPSPYLKLRNDIDKGITYRFLFKTENPLFSSSRLIWIYTPYGYSKEKKYPVLYVFDGMWAVHSRPTINIANNLIYDGKIEPIVIVFISFEDRWNEYVAQSTEFANMVVEEVVPFIEKDFSVSSSPNNRAIIGASAGGHAAIVTAFRHPDIFANVASQGGGAGGSPGLNPLANKALDVYLTKKELYPLRNIYSEVGVYDLQFQNQKLIDGVRQFHERLIENNIDHVYKEINSGHSGGGWDQGLDNILIQFFGK